MKDTYQVEVINGYIARSERHVASQRAIIARLVETGADTILAEAILQKFEAALAEHRRRLAELEERRQRRGPWFMKRRLVVGGGRLGAAERVR